MARGALSTFSNVTPNASVPPSIRNRPAASVARRPRWQRNWRARGPHSPAPRRTGCLTRSPPLSMPSLRTGSRSRNRSRWARWRCLPGRPWSTCVRRASSLGRLSFFRFSFDHPRRGVRGARTARPLVAIALVAHPDRAPPALRPSLSSAGERRAGLLHVRAVLRPDHLPHRALRLPVRVLLPVRHQAGVRPSPGATVRGHGAADAADAAADAADAAAVRPAPAPVLPAHQVSGAEFDSIKREAS